LIRPDYDIEDIVPAYLTNGGKSGGRKGYLDGPGASLYGIPFSPETSILAYRKDIFEANDLEVPKTYDELLKTAQFITGALRALYPEKILLADVQIAEAGSIIAKLAFEAGADWVSGVSGATLTTLEVVLKEAVKQGKEVQLELSREEVIREIVGRMQGFYREGIPFRQNAVGAVELAAKHYRTALASGSEASLIELVTTSRELEGKLEVILSADHVARGKPHPDVYLGAARRLGVAPENCVCLEDSQNGVLAGLNAGMKVIAVPDPDFPVADAVLAKVDVVLTSLDEFTLSRLSSLA